MVYGKFTLRKAKISFGRETNRLEKTAIPLLRSQSSPIPRGPLLPLTRNDARPFVHP